MLKKNDIIINLSMNFTDMAVFFFRLNIGITSTWNNNLAVKGVNLNYSVLKKL